MINYPKYVIRKSINFQFYWVLNASNAQPILNSETYINKQGALDGIASSKRNIADSNFDRRTSISNQPYFVQTASGNNKVIGQSEMYNSVQAREDGIKAVKRDAPIAGIEDLT